jgi:hypothetical protein
MTITYPPAARHRHEQYWKYGPEPGSNAAPHWYVLTATLSAATVVFHHQPDGLRGDDDHPP